MDDHIVSINQQKENIIQFHVSIEGTDSDDATVRLVVDLHNGMMLTFPCVKLSGEEYEARIPALTHIERTAYPCFIEVITNGYYFKAMKGVMNVTGSATITAQPTTTFNKTSSESKPTDDEHKEPPSAEESLSFFTTKPTNPSLGVSGVKDMAVKAIAEQARQKKVSVPEMVIPAVVEDTETSVNPVQETSQETSLNENDDKIKKVLESMGIVSKPKRKIPKLKMARKV